MLISGIRMSQLSRKKELQYAVLQAEVQLNLVIMTSVSMTPQI
jgi:hypothetical protein